MWKNKGVGMLIEIKKSNIGASEVNSVNTRELYEFLGLNESHYSRWIKTNLYENLFFNKDVDFMVIRHNVEIGSGNYREVETAIVTLDTAKHLAMISRSQKAHEIREHFIECEKELKKDTKPNTLSFLTDELEAGIRLANLFGLSGNQSLLSANRTVKNMYGTDLLAISRIELISPKKSLILTPTQIGKEIGLSAVNVNILLNKKGYQHKVNNHWKPTELGKQFAEVLDTNKKHSDGTPVKQVKWNSNIIELLR